MKKLLLMLLILSIPFTSHGWDYRDGIKAVISAKGSNVCLTTNSTNPHDIVDIYGWEDTDVLTWTEVDTLGWIVQSADTSSYTTDKPIGACDKGVLVNIEDGNSSGGSYISHNYGSTISMVGGVDVYIALYVVDIPEAADGASIFFCGQTTSPSTSWIAAIGLYNNGGVIQVKGVGNTSSAWVTLDKNVWYVVKLSLDEAQAANGSSLTINGSTVTFQRNNNSLMYFFYGAIYGLGADEPMTFLLDLFSVDRP